MRPEVALTPPPRLFETECNVCRSKDADAGIDGPDAWVPYTVDLADVRAVRHSYDFDSGTLIDETLVEFAGGDVSRVRSPYRVILQAWRAWREHADAIGRLRN